MAGAAGRRETSGRPWSLIATNGQSGASCPQVPETSKRGRIATFVNNSRMDLNDGALAAFAREPGVRRQGINSEREPCVVRVHGHREIAHLRCASLRNDIEKRKFSANSANDGQPIRLKNDLLKHGLRRRDTICSIR